MATGNPVTLGARVIEQGELAVGNATVQLKTKSTPCSRIWFGAPTANHTIAAVNDGRVLIGTGATATLNKSGGRSLSLDNELGFDVPINDASLIYCTGFNAGDVVEYMIFA